MLESCCTTAGTFQTRWKACRKSAGTFQTRWEACCIAAGSFQTAFYCELFNEILKNDGFIMNSLK
ncbi:hypothetical protein H2O64_13910 [Kordia sp. YSTF-M3]|uniref:Uncharacterized protein n=1 Tax=Kordia aestuariivivens TaxID=2759037 RepID=A0ABR7QB60_9FLAO|nr:hypothetical protein [Kordia aestuariivivens]MBC8755767.1 hypothetical protein [Kordia aestuariivivens]